ncbi:hypothetical protein J1N35_024721 [Gossypium stocksii]|uniref:Reverse transcriptase n=1 Tax=Gossypium stocksii TaxID=47602 RepID=A0A9D3ZXM7_9ROSI|nr:hypothetical protein J1N35_024721 [Gossypium stocksii]
MGEPIELVEPRISDLMDLTTNLVLKNIFCGEGLPTLTRLASQERRIVGAKVCRSAPPITHLMFADDCLLFGEVSARRIQVMKEILREYESCAGQCVNFEKSMVFFNSKVTDQDKNLTLRALNVRCPNKAEKYLGLPNMVGRRKKMTFQNLKGRLKQRINSWSMQHISQGGKERKIQGKREMHWCDWKSLCAPKEEGGMGFRNLNSFNVALLAKQGWHLLRNPNSLLARILKAKYFKDSDFLNSNLKYLPYLTWQSLWSAKGLIMKGLDWRIGDEKNVSI